MTQNQIIPRRPWKIETTHRGVATHSLRTTGVVVRASASQSVDLGFISLVESYQKTLKHGIHSFSVWRLAFRRGCGEQAGKFVCCVLGQATQRDAPTFIWKTGGPDTTKMATLKRVRTSRPKYSLKIRFLVNGG